MRATVVGAACCALKLTSGVAEGARRLSGSVSPGYCPGDAPPSRFGVRSRNGTGTASAGMGGGSLASPSLRLRRRSHQKCLLANARPEPDFMYFSNAYALSASGNPTKVTNIHGLNFAV